MKVLKSLLAVILLLTAVGAGAQEAESEIIIEPVKINDHLYLIHSSSNYDINIVASIGPDGVLLVDSGTEEIGRKLPAALKKLTDTEVKYVINTHVHNDHTGGNKYFKESATIIAHKTVRERMSGKYYSLAAMPQEGIPDNTFDDSLTLNFNGEDIKMIHLPPGHTDGDILVYFTGSNVLCMGDLLFGDNFPYFDIQRGGDIRQYAENVKYVIDNYPEDVMLVGGHRRHYTIEDLKKYHDVLTETTDIIFKQAALGKSAEEMQESKILSNWEDWGQWHFVSTNDWIRWVCGDYRMRQADPVESICKPLTEVIANKGIKEAVRYYHDLKKQHPDDYVFAEQELNTLGYQLMYRDMLDEAIEIFKLNIEAFPESGNVYDSMGEIYLKTGNKDLALKNYRKSLELDPGNDNARQMIEKINSE